MDYSDILTKFLVERGWTQAQLAEKIGISARAVSAIKGREYTPSPKAAEKIKALMAAEGISVYIDGSDADYGYNILAVIEESMTVSDDSTMDEHISAGHFSTEFWNDLQEHRVISYGGANTLRDMLAYYNIDTARFFACCAVHPIAYVDNRGKSETLTIKVFNELISAEIDGAEYFANSENVDGGNMLRIYNSLNSRGRKTIVEYADTMLSSGKYNNVVEDSELKKSAM